jgi:hypothetical protein
MLNSIDPNDPIERFMNIQQHKINRYCDKVMQIGIFTLVTIIIISLCCVFI